MSVPGNRSAPEAVVVKEDIVPAGGSCTLIDGIHEIIEIVKGLEVIVVLHHDAGDAAAFARGLDRGGEGYRLMYMITPLIGGLVRLTLLAIDLTEPGGLFLRVKEEGLVCLRRAGSKTNLGNQLRREGDTAFVPPAMAEGRGGAGRAEAEAVLLVRVQR